MQLDSESCAFDYASVTFCTVEELIAACETSFNVGFDFAKILSSHFSSCILVAIVPGQMVELKF